MNKPTYVSFLYFKGSTIPMSSFKNALNVISEAHTCVCSAVEPGPCICPVLTHLVPEARMHPVCSKLWSLLWSNKCDRKQPGPGDWRLEEWPQDLSSMCSEPSSWEHRRCGECSAVAAGWERVLLAIHGAVRGEIQQVFLPRQPGYSLGPVKSPPSQPWLLRWPVTCFRG